MQTAESWLEYCAGEMKRTGLFFGHGTNNANDEAAWMLLHILKAPLDGSFDQWDIVLTTAQQDKLQKLLARRIDERCPLAYLTGEARFCGLDFIVSPQVLIPRSPVAELIVEQFSPWVKLGEGSRVLDMCTGGGCIAIAMAVYMPGCKVDAVDISPDALDIASQNVERHAVGERVRLVESDLFSALDDSSYDMIVSNPPYVSAGVFEKLPAEYLAEPSTGLVCGEDGLDIVLKIMDAAPQYLKQQGILIMEVGESAETLQEILPRVPFFWLDFEQGGDGVFMLEYDQLIACQADVHAILEQRNNV
ncbi:MAG: 50S ribosomal protein L3 N(5)-glutamine methyltransferase [Lysobacterales bacterium]